jgi:hypothetical protein
MSHVICLFTPGARREQAVVVRVQLGPVPWDAEIDRAVRVAAGGV